MVLRLCIFVCVLLGSHLLHSQSAYTVDFDKTPLIEVVEFLESEFQILSSFDNEKLEGQNITLDLQTKEIATVLERIFEQTDLQYRFVDRDSIIIETKEEPEVITLEGTILDALSSSPLPFANLLLTKQKIGTSTDEDGHYRLTANAVEDDTLKVSYIGYKTQFIAVKDLTSNDPIPVRLAIDDDLVPYLVIKDYLAKGIDLADNGNKTIIRPRTIGLLAGQSNPDILKSIQFLPGIAAPSSQSSEIYIRGGTPDQNLVTWEDIPIYHTAHYFGMISSFNPYVIDQLEVMRGTFSSEYGGRIAGVIKLNMIDEKSQRNFHSIGMDFINLHLEGNQLLGKEKNASFSYSLRRSYNEIWNSPNIQNITQFNQQGFILNEAEISELPPDIIDIKNNFSFLDANAKFSTQLNERNRLKIAAFYFDNDFDSNIFDDGLKNQQKDTFDLENMGFSVSHSIQWNDRINSTLTGTSTAYNFDYNYNFYNSVDTTTFNKGVKQNEIRDNQITYTTEWALPNDQEFKFGYNYLNYNILYVLNNFSSSSNPILEGEDGGSNFHSLFASFKHPISNKLGVNVGLRSTYNSEKQKVYFEPRVSLSKRIKENYTLNFNYGHFYQFIGQVLEFRGSESGLQFPIWALTDDRSTPILDSHFLQLGLLYDKNDWTLELQAYWRKTNGLSSRAFDLVFDPNNETLTGSSESQGLDILIKKKIKKLETWISYSFATTMLSFDRMRLEEFPSDFDQRHSLNLSAIYKWPKISVAFLYKYGSGLPFSKAKDDDPMNSGGGMQAPPLQLQYDGINQFRLRPTHEVNVSCQYRFTPPSDRYKVYVNFAVTNLFNANNKYNRTYYILTTPDRKPRIDYTDKINLKFTPNLGIRLEF